MKKLGASFVKAGSILYLTLACAIVLPGFWGLHCYTVTSGSMEPSIPIGSAVYVKACSFERIKVGQVVTFTLAGSALTVTHRVVSVDQHKRCLRTQGDANEEMDAFWVDESMLVGVVMLTVKGFGRLLLFLGTVKGRVSACLTGLFLFATAEWEENAEHGEGKSIVRKRNR